MYTSTSKGDAMFWNREAWALGVSYRGNDPELDAALTAIATEHGGTPRRLAANPSHRDLGFNFRDRFSADVAREKMLAFRPGVIAATALLPSN
jgi:hypothetical protein